MKPDSILQGEGEELLLPTSPEDVGKRLDAYITENTELTRSAVTKLIEANEVSVNGQPSTKNYRLRNGDCVAVRIPEPEPCEAIPEDIPLDIVYEDEDVAVVNKPCGMVVHPAAGNPSGTLVNALLHHCKGTLSGIGGVIRPGIVHRIDKDTSGLLVVAKNDFAHLALAEQLKEHRVSRIYYAIAVGNLREENGTVNAPIGRHPTDRKRMTVVHHPELRARDAVTHWSVLARGEGENQSFTLLRCELETGRTHQIRVHMASIGHPLLGDPVYGGNRTRFEARHTTHIQGQCLHAGELTFTHPGNGRLMHFYAPLPENMKETVRILFGGDAIPTLN